jgi:hypothetical protein
VLPDVPPLCDALIWQVPAATIDTLDRETLPLNELVVTVQTPGEREIKSTNNPVGVDPLFDVASTLKSESPKVLPERPGKSIVCADNVPTPAMVKVPAT